MEKLQIKFKKLNPNAVIPKQGTAGAAGFDLTAVSIEETDQFVKYYTGIAVQIPAGYFGMLVPRSSVVNTGLLMGNSVGIIDSDYVDNPGNEGEIGFALYNNSDKEVCFRHGERIMQGVFVKYQTVDNDETTDERKGGTGSSGKF